MTITAPHRGGVGTCMHRMESFAYMNVFRYASLQIREKLEFILIDSLIED